MASVSTSSSAEAPSPPDDADPQLCGNCQAALQGAYCHRCGQKHLDTLTFSHILRRLQDLALDVERGLLYTLLRVLRNPGRVARRYVTGERKSFVGPLTVFVLSTTALFIVYSTYQETYVEMQSAQIRSIWTTMGMAPEDVLAALPPEANITAVEDLAVRAFQVQQTVQTYLSLFICFLGALFLRLLLGTYTTVEITVFELYTTSQSMLITAVVTPLLVLVHPSLLLAGGLLTSIGVHVYAAPAFFPETSSLTARILAPLAYLGSVVGFTVALTILGGFIGFAAAFFLS